MSLYNYKGQLCNNCHVLYRQIKTLELQVNDLKHRLGAAVVDTLQGNTDWAANECIEQTPHGPAAKTLKARFSQTASSTWPLDPRGSLMDIEV